MSERTPLTDIYTAAGADGLVLAKPMGTPSRLRLPMLSKAGRLHKEQPQIVLLVSRAIDEDCTHNLPPPPPKLLAALSNGGQEPSRADRYEVADQQVVAVQPRSRWWAGENADRSEC